MSALDWLDDAACKGADRDRFFGSQGDHAAREYALKVCLGCPVRVECLAFHMRVEEIPHGVAGGLKRHERERMAS